jgi:hypothetical protein
MCDFITRYVARSYPNDSPSHRENLQASAAIQPRLSQGCLDSAARTRIKARASPAEILCREVFMATRTMLVLSSLVALAIAAPPAFAANVADGSPQQGSPSAGPSASPNAPSSVDRAQQRAQRRAAHKQARKLHRQQMRQQRQQQQASQPNPS